MPKRRILWFPDKGIDKTMPKYGESTSAIERVEAVHTAYDASNIVVYNAKELVTRRDLKSALSTDFTTIYGICKFNRGLAVAGSSGIYIDNVLKKSRTISGVTYLAPWYDSLYWSDGSAWGFIDDDDTAYDMGIDAPTSDGTDSYDTYYTAFGTIGSWNATTFTLTDLTSKFTAAMVGEYVQVYSAFEDTCFTGNVASVTDADNIVITVDPNETVPASDAGADILWYISPFRRLTHAAYLATGGYVIDDASGTAYPYITKYKVRFKRPDGVRSNTVTLGSSITSGPYKDYHVGIALVGGLSVTDIPDSSDDSEVDEIELFRLDATATTSNVYRRITTLDIGTTTYSDVIEITSSLTALDDDNKYPCPYVLSNLCFYSSRLWGTYQNRVYYSEAYVTESRFQYFGPIGENYFEFPDTVKTIVPDQRRIVVFLERETWVLEGFAPDSMTKRVMNEDIGTYSSTSAERFAGSIYTVSADFKFYAISGATWKESSQITSVLSTSPSYYELRGSDNCLWISDGTSIHRIETSNQDLWTYALGGRLGTGSHTTYVGVDGRLYELDALGGNESTPVSYVESPYIYIGDAAGRRGLFNRIFFRGSVDTGTVTVYIDGVTWKTMTFNASTERNVVLHFFPARGYYAKVRIAAPLYNELALTSRVIFNPW